ncbi:MAG: hypothetical protein ACXVHQ_28480 [Solirubrobacteraceae bacterium]
MARLRSLLLAQSQDWADTLVMGRGHDPVGLRSGPVRGDRNVAIPIAGSKATAEVKAMIRSDERPCVDAAQAALVDRA